MGMIERLLGLVFGGGQNVVRDTVEVFRENAEGGAVRAAEVRAQALEQFGAEFGLRERGRFDRFMDGLNRLPRPALAIGTLGLFVSAMVAPLWFAQRMQGIALVPEPLWWLLGVIVSFYFGARHQLKNQEFQRDLAGTMARVPQVLDNIGAIRALEGEGPETVRGASMAPALLTPQRTKREGLAPWHPKGNAALDAWRAARG